MLKKYVVAIDPGTTESGVCIVRTDDCKPLFADKIQNELVYDTVIDWFDKNEYFINWISKEVDLVIERMQGNNFSVGSSVFETCEWIGEFRTLFRENLDIPTKYLYRRDEYKCLCGNIYTKNDTGIRQALVDMFANGEPNFGKGCKANPGWFYGFKQDTWAAYSIAITFIEAVRSIESTKRDFTDDEIF